MDQTALVIIDLQKGILNGGARSAETAKALDATTQRIAGLLGRAREAKVPVIFVQHDGGPGHRLEVNSKGWEIRDEIAPMAGELIVHKRACDSFYETPLGAELSKRKVGRLVIAGCMTQYCIDTTVRRAVSVGYEVVLAADGHMTEDSGGLTFEQIIRHHNGLLDGFDAGEHCATVVPIAGIEF